MRTQITRAGLEGDLAQAISPAPRSPGRPAPRLLPDLPLTPDCQFSPTAPGSPPAAPQGAWRRRSERIVTWRRPEARSRAPGRRPRASGPRRLSRGAAHNASPAADTRTPAPRPACSGCWSCARARPTGRLRRAPRPCRRRWSRSRRSGRRRRHRPPIGDVVHGALRRGRRQVGQRLAERAQQHVHDPLRRLHVARPPPQPGTGRSPACLPAGSRAPAGRCRRWSAPGRRPAGSAPRRTRRTA